MPSSVSAEVLREHLRYSAWASARLVHALESLPSEQLTHDFKTSDHTLLGTLVHVFAADRVWLARIKGETVAGFVSEADYRLEVLQNDWPRLHEQWNEWAAALTDENAGAVHSYRDLKGNAWFNAAWEIVLHVVNHATHHRGQAAGFLRAMGHTPPVLDLIKYYREVR